MRVTGQHEGPHSAEDIEVFDRLHLSGTPGKVRITLSERKLSIEQKSGHCVEINNDWVMKMDHTNKPLLPFGYAFFGALLLWVASRGMVFGTTPQLLTFGVGLSLMVAHFGLSRPTLTIETQTHDWYMLTGNDARLMRLGELHRRLTKGQTMTQARLGLDELQRDVDYPRSQINDFVPAEPVHLEAPLAIATLLSQHGDPELVPESAEPLQFHGSTEPLDLDFGEPETEGWMFGEPEAAPHFQTHEHGLIQRGRDNARDRRTNQMGHAIQPASVEHVHHPAHPYPIHTSRPVERSYGLIADSNQHLPQQHQVGHTTQSPQEFLPSFVGPEGAHVPTSVEAPTMIDEFDMFATDLNLFSEPEAGSVIDSARVKEEPLDAEIVPEEPAPPRTKNSQFTVKTKPSGLSTGRYKIHRTTSQTGSRMRTILNNITESATLAGQLLTGSRPDNEHNGEQASDTGRELRDRSSKTHLQEMEDSVINLSQQHGGVLPKEEVARLTQHVSRRHSIVEQLEQEIEQQAPAVDLDELSFSELTEVTTSGENSGASGLSKMDL